MGGFIKGIMVGLVSFGLGFAVLSVVLPVEPPVAAPEADSTGLLDGAEVGPAAEPLAPATQNAGQPLEPGVAEPESLAAGDDAPVTGEAGPGAAAEAPPAEMAGDGAQTEAVQTEAVQPESPEPAAPPPVMAEAADPAPGADSAPDAPPVSAALPVAGTAAGDGDAPMAMAPEAPAGAEQRTTPENAAPGNAASENAASESPARVAAPAASEAPDPDDASAPAAAAPARVAPPVAAEVPPVTGAAAAALDTPAAARAARPADDAMAPDTAAPAATPAAGAAAGAAPAVLPVTGPAGDPGDPGGAGTLAAPALTPGATPDAPGETPAPLAPVPATTTPASEPLLPQTAPQPDAETAAATEPAPPAEPAARPRVQAMPTGAAGIAVNRGGAGDDSAVRRGGGAMAGRLPTLGDAANGSAADSPAAAEPDLSGLPAVQRFAATPALLAGEVPLGVVLIEAAEAETAILALALPVTVALDPADPDAPRRATAYRAAGHEIALIATGVPALATPSDLAVTLDGWRRAFPETVAIVDRPVNGLGANPPLARSLAAMLTDAGLGAIALRDGRDAWLGAARNAGLPTAPVYRDLDEGGQNEFTVRRLIDRAAFEALRQPGIVIAGSAADPAVMSELAGFARGGGRAGVGLAPATSVFQRR